jgi:hypothetical protein
MLTEAQAKELEKAQSWVVSQVITLYFFLNLRTLIEK